MGHHPRPGREPMTVSCPVSRGGRRPKTERRGRRRQSPKSPGETRTSPWPPAGTPAEQASSREVPVPVSTAMWTALSLCTDSPLGGGTEVCGAMETAGLEGGDEFKIPGPNMPLSKSNFKVRT